MELENRRMKPGKEREPGRLGRGFTLIELLAVISIMAILAGLLVGLAPQATARIRESRTRAELAKLVMGIEAYKSKYGVYPPDNVTGTGPDGLPVVNPVINPLFYELTGLMVVQQGVGGYFVPLGDRDGALVRLNPDAHVRAFFNRDGFVNAQPTNYLRRLFRMEFKEAQYAEISTDPDIEVLVAPVPWPLNNANFPPPIPNRPRLNPWRYNSSHPVHNPGSYDLWAEIIVRGQRRVIGNWKN
jgi:prepilin-type N-terminal cleavage/methylation domain-containing protein